MKYNNMICEVCGGNEFREKDANLICCHCGATYLNIVNEETDEEKDAKILRISRLDDAEKELRLSPPNFDLAEDKFSDLIKQYPNWSAAYWGIVRAKYGIKYEIDLDGKSVPSCYKSGYEDFTDDLYFKKVLQFAETQSLKEKYQTEGNRIAQTCKEWREKAKKHKYDIFLSFKASENGNETKDTRVMQNLYTYLIGKGYKVFFSPISMREVAGKLNWDAYIFNALEKSSVMILYGSSADYFSTTWVENEWTRYLRMIGRGFKNPDSLIISYEGFDANSLPRQLRNRQALNAAERTWYETLLARVTDIMNTEIVKPAAIEHKQIKEGRVGKKVTEIKDQIKIVEVGTTVVTKKTTIVPSVEIKKESLKSKEIYVPSVSDSLKTGLVCLQQGSFFEAEMFFNECLNSNKNNGDAWLGLLCVKLQDSRLFDKLSDESFIHDKSDNNVQNTQIIDVQRFLNSAEEIENAIEFSTNQIVAENLLGIVCAQIKSIVCKAETEVKYNLIDFVNLVLKYDSKVYQALLDFLAMNSIILSKICMSEQYEQLIDIVSNHLSDVDKYTKFLEGTVDGYLQLSNIEMAKKWNNKLLEFDESNYSYVLRGLFFLIGATNKPDFIEKLKEISAKKEIIAYCENAISKMSKDDACVLLSFLCLCEKSCINNGLFDNAQSIFNFIVKYDFTERKDFLQSQVEYFSIFATNNQQSFFELVLAAMNYMAVDWHIEQRLQFAAYLREQKKFDDAKKMYETVLSLEESNYKAFNGILLCEIECHSIFSVDLLIKWDKFNLASFEKILSTCPDKKNQNQIIKQYINICISCVKTETNDLIKCTHVFDELIKYFSMESEKTIYGFIDDMTEALLYVGHFDIAVKYANLSLQNEPTYNIKARQALLFAKLECQNNDEFIKCSHFDRNMPEYKMLLLACQGNAEKLKDIVEMAKKNNQYKADEEEKQIQALQALNEKAEKEELELKSAKYQKKVEEKLMIYKTFRVITIWICITMLLAWLTTREDYEYPAIFLYWCSVAICLSSILLALMLSNYTCRINTDKIVGCDLILSGLCVITAWVSLGFWEGVCVGVLLFSCSGFVYSKL